MLLTISPQRFDNLFNHVVWDIERREIRRPQNRFDHPVGMLLYPIYALDDFR